MLFNSIEFLLFLPVVFCLYWFVFGRSLKWQNGFILCASYFFYGWWSYKFLALLALSTLLDYTYGFWVASPNAKKARFFLWLSIINNLGILAVFKYYNFFAGEMQHLFEVLGLHLSPVFLQLALPIGISFYTFHGMSYVFDIYRGKQKPVSSFIDYAVFVSFFPMLVAGPIERAGHLLPQVQSRRSFNYSQAVYGCRLILWGLFKKVVIADSLAPTVNWIFNDYGHHNAYTLMIGAIVFSFQIYGDFSGYSDIALGTARLFGFELLSNFKFPYFSRDVAEFWRRWHISLSSWFRDYLYIPLGGSKQGRFTAIRNTFIIFIVSGFWHGANWSFIAWGTLHACGFLPLLLLNRNRKHVLDVAAQDRRWPRLKELVQMLFTFTFVTIAWVFFRAETVAKAYYYLRRIGAGIVKDPGQFLHAPECKSVFLYVVPLVIIDWWLRRDERDLRTIPNRFLRWAVYLILFVLIASCMVGYLFNKQPASFIYFQF